ncbi:hypothetical protein PMNALOAF_0323 [Methylobacterium adhaesivum]|uniref:HTH lysR-type domain-containing protein n=1 Tax=Methylobacterium adhaesivum TaxID=333297 RepID=A0ABT8BD71_9HYPH|nr:hypothetical protein [Methylobacterium adhaesivum]MDN3590028.1 hypothetical protein [Methylobacterium adhaesivum]GJD29091.1 hypothetical protein PMNALOAF_0323 [Methylobacterium adhaesivum]
MAQLEATLGFALFVRGHGSARPTPEGAAFAREVERTYAGLDHLTRATREIRELGTGLLDSRRSPPPPRRAFRGAGGPARACFRYNLGLGSLSVDAVCIMPRGHALARWRANWIADLADDMKIAVELRG